MSKVPKLIIDPILFEPLPKGKIIKSMTNKAYQKIKDMPIN